MFFSKVMLERKYPHKQELPVNRHSKSMAAIVPELFFRRFCGVELLFGRAEAAKQVFILPEGIAV